MSAAEVSLNFDDLIEAVKESGRGRWFLQEYESRLRKSDTGNILSAIAKLENVVATAGSASGDSALVARAKAAITAARAEIASLDQGKAKFSEEAHLFAKLAEMARASFPADSSVAAGVNRALKLVEDLEQEFGVATSKPLKKSELFSADSDVFEAEPVPNPVSVPNVTVAKTAAPATKEVERGAKLIIRKTSIQPEQPAPDNSPITQESAPPLAMETAPEPAGADIQPIVPPEPRQSRVVIIRRKPEDMMELPLVSETQDAVSAA
jgi:hypothetical protein